MNRHNYFKRVHIQTSKIADQNARTREVLAMATEIWKIPIADTFLGRKTQEPFPKRKQTEASTSGPP